MKSQPKSSAWFFLCTVLVFVLASCSASRKNDGFSYHTDGSGLDIGAGAKVTPPEAATPPVAEPQTISSTDLSAKTQALLNDETLSSKDKEQLQTVSTMVQAAYKKQENIHLATGNPIPVSSEEILKNVSEQMTASGMIEKPSQKKMSQLNRVLAKMGMSSKQQNNSGSSFLGEGNMLLFAVIALAGLVVGIFVHWIGWVVFAVFGAIWLFKKLS